MSITTTDSTTGVAGKVIGGIVATAAILLAVGAVTTSVSPEVTTQSAPVASDVAEPSASDVAIMATEWDEWASANVARVRAASDSLKDVKAAANARDQFWVARGLYSASSSLLAVDDTPDGGAVSDKIHQAGEMYAEAAALAEVGDIDGAARAVIRVTPAEASR
jgi:hypothetical protein